MAYKLQDIQIRQNGVIYKPKNMVNKYTFSMWSKLWIFVKCEMITDVWNSHQNIPLLLELQRQKTFIYPIAYYQRIASLQKKEPKLCFFLKAFFCCLPFELAKSNCIWSPALLPNGRTPPCTSLHLQPTVRGEKAALCAGRTIQAGFPAGTQ